MLETKTIRSTTNKSDTNNRPKNHQNLSKNRTNTQSTISEGTRIYPWSTKKPFPDKKITPFIQIFYWVCDSFEHNIIAGFLNGPNNWMSNQTITYSYPLEKEKTKKNILGSLGITICHTNHLKFLYQRWQIDGKLTQPKTYGKDM